MGPRAHHRPQGNSRILWVRGIPPLLHAKHVPRVCNAKAVAATIQGHVQPVPLARLKPNRARAADGMKNAPRSRRVLRGITAQIRVILLRHLGSARRVRSARTRPLLAIGTIHASRAPTAVRSFSQKAVADQMLGNVRCAHLVVSTTRPPHNGVAQASIFAPSAGKAAVVQMELAFRVRSGAFQIDQAPAAALCALAGDLATRVGPAQQTVPASVWLVTCALWVPSVQMVRALASHRPSLRRAVAQPMFAPQAVQLPLRCRWDTTVLDRKARTILRRTLRGPAWVRCFAHPGTFARAVSGSIARKDTAALRDQSHPCHAVG
jgi:hypothetical protein